MEKWKIGVIALLLAGLVGYGFFQQKATEPPEPVKTSPTPDSQWVGKTLPAWPSINQWLNTPAPVDLQKWRGKIVLVEVFRTECPHCRDAAPFLVALSARYKTRGLEIVSIQSPGDYNDPQNVENDWIAVQKWLKERHVKWPVGFDKGSQWFQKTLKGNFYPAMFVLDKNGKITFFHTGHTEDKAVDLAFEIERQLVGGKLSATQMENLATWLTQTLFGGDKSIQKALVKDLNARLQEAG